MSDKLTSEGLVERLPLLNAREVCDRSGIDYMRFKNWRQGRIKSLTDDELQRIAEVLRTIPSNAKDYRATPKT